MRLAPALPYGRLLAFLSLAALSAPANAQYQIELKDQDGERSKDEL